MVFALVRAFWASDGTDAKRNAKANALSPATLPLSQI